MVKTKKGISIVVLVILGIVSSIVVLFIFGTIIGSLTPDGINPLDPTMAKVVKYITNAPGGGMISNGIARLYLTTAGAPAIVIYGKNNEWYKESKYCKWIFTDLNPNAIKVLQTYGYLPSSCSKLQEFLKDDEHKKKYYEFLINYLTARNIYYAYTITGKDDGHWAGYDTLVRMPCFMYPDFDIPNGLCIDEEAVSAILAAFNKKVCGSLLTNYIQFSKKNPIALILNTSGVIDANNNACFTAKPASDNDVIRFMVDGTQGLKVCLYKDIYAQFQRIPLDTSFFKNVLKLKPRAICLLIGIDDNGAAGDQQYNMLVVRSYFLIAPKDWGLSKIRYKIKEDVTSIARAKTENADPIYAFACYYIGPVEDRIKKYCEKYVFKHTILGSCYPYEYTCTNYISPLNREIPVEREAYRYFTGIETSIKEIRDSIRKYLTKAICGYESSIPFECLNYQDPLLSPGSITGSPQDLYNKITQSNKFNFLAINIINPSDTIENYVIEYYKAIKNRDPNLATSVIYTISISRNNLETYIIIHPLALYSSSNLVTYFNYELYYYEVLRPTFFNTFYKTVNTATCPNADKIRNLFCNEICYYVGKKKKCSKVCPDNPENLYYIPIELSTLCNLNTINFDDQISITYGIFIVSDDGIKYNEYVGNWTKVFDPIVSRESIIW